MTLVAVPCAVVSYSTCELFTHGTVTPGAGTAWEEKGVIMIWCSMWLQCGVHASVLCVGSAGV